MAMVLSSFSIIRSIFRFFLEGEPATTGEDITDFFNVVPVFDALVPFLGIDLMTELLKPVSSFFGEIEELLLVYCQ